MRTGVTIALLAPILIFGLGSCTDCSRSKSGVEYKNQLSTLSFDKMDHNFGVINEVDGVVEHTFLFANSGKSAVVIEQVAVSCGCTTPEYSKEPILPGRRGEIKIAFNPYMRPGVFSKGVIVVSGGGRNRDELTVSGEVVPRPLTLEEQYPFSSEWGLRFSTAHINFRESAQESTSSMAIGYHNASVRDLSFSLEANELSDMLFILAPIKIEAGARGEITLTLRPAAGRYGSFAQRLHPTIGGVRSEDREGSYSLFVQGFVVDDFRGTALDRAPMAQIEAYAKVDGLRQEGRASAEVEIRNSGGGDLIVRAVECGEHVYTDLEAGRLIKPNNIATFSVGIDARQLDVGLYMNTITLVMNDPNRPVQTLRVVGEVGSKQ